MPLLAPLALHVEQVVPEAAVETVHDWFQIAFHMSGAGARKRLGMSWTHRQLSGLRHAKVSTPSGNRHFLALPGLLGMSFASGLRGACGFRWPCSVCPLPTCMPWSLSARSLAGAHLRFISRMLHQCCTHGCSCALLSLCGLSIIQIENSTTRVRTFIHCMSSYLLASVKQLLVLPGEKRSVGVLGETTWLLLSPCSSCPRPT